MPPAIHLHPLSPTDLDEVFPLWSDFEAVRFTNWTHTPTHEECTHRLARVLAFYGAEPRHLGPFAVRADGLGFVGLAGADLRDAEGGTHEVWYALRRERWGHGLGTRVLGALIERAVARGDVRRLEATAVTGNVASWRLLEKHGFRRLGVQAGAHTKHGETLDLYSYARDLGP
jgi:RimJ/RimL family protein N-acetyltransferase